MRSDIPDELSQAISDISKCVGTIEHYSRYYEIAGKGRKLVFSLRQIEAKIISIRKKVDAKAVAAAAMNQIIEASAVIDELRAAKKQVIDEHEERSKNAIVADSSSIGKAISDYAASRGTTVGHNISWTGD